MSGGDLTPDCVDDSIDVVFTPAEKLALRPPGTLLPDAWGEQKRVLPEKNPLGRRWRNDHAPPLRVVMQLAVDPLISELYLQKAGQIGGSESIRNVLGCTAEQEPSPWLIILADEKTARKQFKDEYWPIYRDTPDLAALLAGRLTKSGVRLLNGHECDIGWAGSPASMASSPKCYVLLDELDKYLHAEMKEAPPVDLARVRLRKFGRRAKLYAVTTPTHGEAPMAKLMALADIVLRYYVPCPHCGTMQTLHQDRLRWEKHPELLPNQTAALIEERGAAWFECESPECGGRIYERQKRDIVPLGYWADAEQQWRLYPDGRREGKKPPGRNVGMHLPAFYDYQTPWPGIAASIIRAGRDPELLKGLYNSTFGEPFTQRIASVAENDFARRCVADPERDFVPARAGVVPTWASRLILTVDTQKDHFYWVLRAWGHAKRSQRVAHGMCRTFADLDEIEARLWPYHQMEGGGGYAPVAAFRTGIDSGGTAVVDPALADEVPGESRTRQVYEWCRRNPGRRLPLKGASTPIAAGVRYSDIVNHGPGATRDPYEVRLWLFDPETYGDLLMTALDGQVPAGEADAEGAAMLAAEWSLNDQNDEIYNRQLGNVHKIVVKKRLKWVPKSIGARHDYWDCEKMQFALADGMQLCTALPTPRELAGVMALASQPTVAAMAGGIRKPDGRGFFTRKS